MSRLTEEEELAKLKRMVREGLTEKVTVQEIPEESDKG